jgi:hypothetical protein
LAQAIAVTINDALVILQYRHSDFVVRSGWIDVHSATLSLFDRVLRHNATPGLNAPA